MSGGRKVKAHDPAQLGFGGLLEAADADNAARVFDRRTAHLPGSMEDGVVYFRGLIDRHHAAMMIGDVKTVMALRAEAGDLAVKLNRGEPGILADETAAGCVLVARTAAASDAVPFWGQRGTFIIDASGMRVRIEMDGLFGIGCSFSFWPGFAAHAVHEDRPFLSETGYRSFLGIHAEPVAGLTPDQFAARVIEAFVGHDLKGRLKAIEPRWRERREDAG